MHDAAIKSHTFRDISHIIDTKQNPLVSEGENFFWNVNSKNKICLNLI